MSRSILCCVLVSVQAAGLGLGTAAAQENVNPAFSFGGIEAFWSIVAVLESDTEPTPSQWTGFFEAPGYKRLTDSEFGRDYFKNALRAVFMPSRSNLEDEMLSEYEERGGFLAWYTPLVLDGFRRASHDREWQAQRVQELKTYPYLERAAQFALEYLPEESVDDYPAVDFIVFNDSRGYTPLIIGLTGNDDPPPSQLECLEREGHDRHFPFVLHMAHESFHTYRGRTQEIEFPARDHQDYPVLWILDQMENEGIGDLIHRKRLYYPDGCLAVTEQAARLHKEQLAQPATIRIIDKILSELADDPALTVMLGRQLQSFIPQSGHPTGFYMANIIEDELGAEAITNVVCNPFKFIELYNRAARKNGNAPVFSTRAVAYIRSLERRYTKPRGTR
jgi:hypothetical protein